MLRRRAPEERLAGRYRHDERAREAGRTLRAPLNACGDTFARFFEAVDGDDRAKAILSRGFERLGRTLELLFGDADSYELRALVTRLRSPTAR